MTPFRLQIRKLFFSNTLYDVLTDLENSSTGAYTRMIVIADGVDNETLGYTESELHKRIKDALIPIYTIGCSANNNEENLKNMFSLSRLSNGKSYLVDEIGFPGILQDILQDTNMMKLTIFPPEVLCDGTVKSIRISIGEAYCTAELKMPFKEISAKSKTVPETTAPPLETAPVDLKEEISLSFMPLLIGGLGVCAVCSIIAVIMLSKKKKAASRKTADQQSGWSPLTEHASESFFSEGETEIMPPYHQSAADDATGIISGSRSVKLCLQDVKDPSKTFEYPIRDRVLIGRDHTKCQIVIDYNQYISSIHCEVLAKGGGYIVRDGGGTVIASKNGTFVNEKKAAPEQFLPSGSVLRLGEVSFKVTFR